MTSVDAARVFVAPDGNAIGPLGARPICLAPTTAPDGFWRRRCAVLVLGSHRPGWLRIGILQRLLAWTEWDDGVQAVVAVAAVAAAVAGAAVVVRPVGGPTFFCPCTTCCVLCPIRWLSLRLRSLHYPGPGRWETDHPD